MHIGNSETRLPFQDQCLYAIRLYMQLLIAFCLAMVLLNTVPWQVDKMEEVAQGRVWTGNDAASRGLVDAIGGLSRAVAIAKQKANIPQDKQVLSFVKLI